MSDDNKRMSVQYLEELRASHPAYDRDPQRWRSLYLGEWRSTKLRCSRRQVAYPFEQCPSSAVVRLILPEAGYREPHEVACLPCATAFIAQMKAEDQILLQKLRI